MKSNSYSENSARFISLKKRLTIMGYGDLPLGLDSAPLVQQMLNDLVTTTESLRDNEMELNHTRQKIEILEAQIEPLQSENTRLTRENVQLHQQLISSSEDAVKLENQHFIVSHELQTENRRLRLLNQKASQHVQELQKALDDAREKLQKSLAAPSIMKTPEQLDMFPKKNRNNSRSQNTTKTGSSIISKDSFHSPTLTFDPTLFKTELENLRKERDDALKNSETATHRIAELENSIKFRDDEIHRLGQCLQRETGKNGYLVSLRHKYEQQNDEIDKLRAQIRVGRSPKKPKEKKHLTLTAPKPLFSNENIIDLDDATLLSPLSNLLEEEEEEFSDEEDTPKPKPPITPEAFVLIEEEEESQPEKPIAESPKQKSFSFSKSKSSVKSNDSDNSNDENELKEKIESLTNEISKKDQIISSMTTDFTFLSENMQKLMKEKDEIIKQLKEKLNEPAEIIIDTGKLDKLQQQLDDLKDEYEENVSSKDKQIQQLQALVQSLSIKTTPQQCVDCMKLRQELEKTQNEKNLTEQTSNEKMEKLKLRISQLEVLIRASEENKRESIVLDEQLQIAQHKLTERDTQNEKLRAQISSLESQLNTCKLSLEETQRKIQKHPDIEAKYKGIINQLKADQISITNEAKKAKIEHKMANERLIEMQRQNRELQSKLQKAREEASENQKDAIFQRSKTEEIKKALDEQNASITRESLATSKHLQAQLNDKTKEAEMFQKLLSDARKQLANLLTGTIPQYKKQISVLNRQKEEMTAAINSVSKLASYIEQHVDNDSSDNVALISALHHLQEKLKQFS
ncbi:centrosomal protein [Histomonas meleagridis]|uniref:centrosomal protein n=1 Tax=Histomonas meleagridis TaxID=135588 RepID=UPI0035599C8F|nr:centrosomal protein [Histomonas meleagridis]KAH0805121.1 centrosomal protein [Histomonas meleagridis]